MNLMEEMRDKYYPFKHSRNLHEALEIIEEAMKRGEPNVDMWDHWVDLPNDWVVDMDTLDELKKQGFRVVKRWSDRGTIDEHYWFLVSWDTYEEWPTDEEY